MNGKSFMVAGAAALLIISGAITTRADEGAAGSTQVKCMGVNSCKGQGACSSAKNDCKGKNACKGQGWTPMSSAQDCTAKGGTIVPSKPKAM